LHNNLFNAPRGHAWFNTLTEVNGMKFGINKKYKLKVDYTDAALGKIPAGMSFTFMSSTGGSCKFKLPNGKLLTIPEKQALTIMQE
jgi:hypothetical protein